LTALTALRPSAASSRHVRVRPGQPTDVRADPGAAPGVRPLPDPQPPARLLLPQTGQQLRWGRLEVSLVRGDRGVLRPRAVAVIPFNLYLRGLGEMPGSFAYAALRAQAIAARSFALVATQTRGQHSGRGLWDGCDCAVYATVRDQRYLGYVNEVGVGGGGGSRPCAAPGPGWCAGGAGPCSLLLVLLGRLDLQQRPVGERPPGPGSPAPRPR
jgi:hypothetical protein